MDLFERKRLLFKVFLHVNRELDDFQRATLQKVFDGLFMEAVDLKPDLEPIKVAITDINQRLFLLSREGWKPVMAKGDAVLKPAHYDRYPMEPTYFLVTSGRYHWCIENFVKYIVRFPFKNGLEDLGKAMRNLNMFVKEQEGDPQWSR